MTGSKLEPPTDEQRERHLRVVLSQLGGDGCECVGCFLLRLLDVERRAHEQDVRLADRVISDRNETIRSLRDQLTSKAKQ